MKAFIKRVSAFVLLAVAAVFLFLYSVGNIVPVSQTPETDISDDTVPEVQIPSVPQKSDSELVSETLIQLKQNGQTALASGYTVSDGVYRTEEYVLASVQTDTVFPKNAKYSFDVLSEDGTAVTYTDFVLHPHMGYISLNDGTNSALLSSNGNALVIPAEYSLSPVGARDKDGNPVFVDKNTWGYFTLAEDGTVTASDYDAERDFRGVNFDYPSYYGVSDDQNYEVVSSRRGYGYRINGENEVNAVYKKAFAYSEGFGCAYDAQNRLYFFNFEGRLRIAGLAEIMYGCGDRTDERSLGYYYFDEGLTRVTKRTYSRGKLVSERETFINRRGDEFKTPEDYNVYSYSNGMILLEKDGLGGYMNSRGKWLVQPIYTYTRPFFEGLAVVGYTDGKKGMIDKSGAFVIPPVFDEITDCSGGVICAYSKDNGWQVINKLKSPAETPPENAENVG